MTAKSLEDKITACLSACPCLAGWTLLHASQNVKKQKRPLAVIDIGDQDRTPWQEGTLTAEGETGPGARILTARETFQLRLSLYADDAKAVGDRLGFELQETEAGYLTSVEQGIGWRPDSQSVPSPELRDDLSFEPRVIFTIRGNHVLEYVETVAIIETVNEDVSTLPQLES